MIMSAVNITNVTVLDNPTAFLSPFQFEISYECLVPLEDGMVLDRKKKNLRLEQGNERSYLDCDFITSFGFDASFGIILLFVMD